jgi:hypothetical protein
MTDVVEPAAGTSNLVSVIIPARDAAGTIGDLVSECGPRRRRGASSKSS